MIKKLIAIYILCIMTLLNQSVYAGQLKTVIGKEHPNENRFSAGDFFFGSGSITKTKTIYYLIAEDGTVCEVGLSAYYKTKIGSKYNCNWERR